jgi:hypothetical protein
VDLVTGRSVKARGLELRTKGFTSPVVADGKLFVAGGLKSGWKLFMVNADPRDFRRLAEFVQADGCDYVSPTIADGRMYLRLRDRIACYDLRAAAGR